MSRWLLIFWLFIVSAVAFLDRVNIAVAATTIAHEFYLNNIQLGAVMSASCGATRCFRLRAVR